MKKEEIKFKISIDSSQVWNKISGFVEQMEQLNQEQNTLNQQMKQGYLSIEKYQQAIQRNTENINRCRRAMSELSQAFIQQRIATNYTPTNIANELTDNKTFVGTQTQNQTADYREQLSLLLSELESISPILTELCEQEAKQLELLSSYIQIAKQTNDSQSRNERDNRYQANSIEKSLPTQEATSPLNDVEKEELQPREELLIASNERIYDNKQSLAKELQQLDIEQQNTFEQQLNQRVIMSEQLVDTISNCMDSMAEKSEAFAAFSKAMALFQIGIDTATALSKGISSAQVVPFPGNLAAIVTTTATILANIAKAKQHLSASLPTYATGGRVHGIGSGTSDSVTAKLSAGESVITAQATTMFAPLLSALNQIGGGVPISTQDSAQQVMGEDMLTRAFAKAIQQMPSPVVSVREIEQIRNRRQDTRAFDL